MKLGFVYTFLSLFGLAFCLEANNWTDINLFFEECLGDDWENYDVILTPMNNLAIINKESRLFNISGVDHDLFECWRALNTTIMISLSDTSTGLPPGRILTPADEVDSDELNHWQPNNGTIGPPSGIERRSDIYARTTGYEKDNKCLGDIVFEQYEYVLNECVKVI